MLVAKNYPGIKTRAKPRQIVCYFYRMSMFVYNARGRRKYRQNGHAYTSHTTTNKWPIVPPGLLMFRCQKPWCSWRKPAPELCSRGAQAQAQPEQDSKCCLCPQNNWGCQEPFFWQELKHFFLDNSYSTVKDPYKKKKFNCWLSCSSRR